MTVSTKHPNFTKLKHRMFRILRSSEDSAKRSFDSARVEESPRKLPKDLLQIVNDNFELELETDDLHMDGFQLETESIEMKSFQIDNLQLETEMNNFQLQLSADKDQQELNIPRDSVECPVMSSSSLTTVPSASYLFNNNINTNITEPRNGDSLFPKIDTSQFDPENPNFISMTPSGSD